jgi:hypothetical protein
MYRLSFRLVSLVILLDNGCQELYHQTKRVVKPGFGKTGEFSYLVMFHYDIPNPHTNDLYPL